MLDTNILSELSKAKPNENVIRKVNELGNQCVTAALVMHELNFGVLRLPEGKLKTNLLLFLKQLENYKFPVLSYDGIAAQNHAIQRSNLTAKGLTPSFVDGQIAAIAQSNDLILVTRNTKDFENFSNITLENWFL